jgi:hypothetical protein
MNRKAQCLTPYLCVRREGETSVRTLMDIPPEVLHPLMFAAKKMGIPLELLECCMPLKELLQWRDQTQLCFK